MGETAIAMRVHEPDGPLRAEEVPVSAPTAGWVRVAVAASGVCHADLATAAAHRADGTPVTPGHEIAGVIVELGEGVSGWHLGQRVAVGWFGGSCGHCDACRRGDVVHCSERATPGVSYPGGWASSITVPASALAAIPDELDFAAAAPMGCAGVTTFNAVRHAGVPVGGRIAVLGLGGLGHLAVQFAAAMGYEVTAIARGPERAALAAELGAHHYLDSTAVATGSTLREAGGVDAIISMVPTTAPLTELLEGLRVRGRLVLVGVGPGSLELPAGRLVMNAQSVTGHLTGSPLDIEQAMRFAVLTGVRPRVERMPLDRVGEALQRLREGKVRFRTVLEPPAAVASSPD